MVASAAAVVAAGSASGAPQSKTLDVRVAALGVTPSAAAGTELTLVDVSFSALLGKIDLIGRRAHIEFLRNKQYVDTLVWTLDAVYE